MEAKGFNGNLILGQGYIEIVRKGFKSFLFHGLKGNKRIPLKQISAIQFKPAGLSYGYIQFSFIGGTESKSSWKGSFSDENTINFKKKQQPEFEKIKEAIEKEIYK